jgi:hypothetical protein
VTDFNNMDEAPAADDPLTLEVDPGEIFGEPDEMVGEDEGDSGTADVPAEVSSDADAGADS